MAKGMDKTVISFKGAITVDGHVLINDSDVLALIVKLKELGIKFEGGAVYLSHKTGETYYGGATLQNQNQ